MSNLQPLDQYELALLEDEKQRATMWRAVDEDIDDLPDDDLDRPLSDKTRQWIYDDLDRPLSDKTRQWIYDNF